MTAKNIFITGATGFLGINLARAMLKKQDIKLIALARSFKDKSAYKRLEEVLQGHNVNKFEVIEGDIVRPNLGIGSKLEKKLLEKIDEVWHLAGSTKFEEEKNESDVSLNNVDGTQNILKFAKKIKNLRLLMYTSTAYVAGDRKGVVYEEELDKGQGFHNIYERSKFEAEKLVRTYIQQGMKGIIVRPSIIAGNSITGETQSFKMFYWPWMAVDLVKKIFLDKNNDIKYNNEGKLFLPLRIIGKEDAAINIIPVDYVVAMMLNLANNEQSIGKTFHLINPEYVTVGFLKELISKKLKVYGIELINSIKDINFNFIEKFYEKLTKPYQPYMLHNGPIFDMSNTHKIIKDVKVPKPDNALLEILLHYCINKNWGIN